MSDKKISQLTAAATLVGTEIIPIVQSGVTVKSTAQDIADLAPAPVAPYKVYTALLTQSGGDDPQSISSGALVKGVTYYVTSTGGGNEDFSNVGLPVFYDGASFVSTADAEPINWGGGGLTYNTGAPVVTVLENTIGNVYWTYIQQGSYQIPFEACATVGITMTNSTSFISKNKVSQNITLIIFDDGDGPIVQIYTNAQNGSASNDILFNTPIEIRVYN